jgi:small subunit ribosomal protein S16
MVRIRLARGGAKKKPYYRIVVADQRCKRDGRYLERIGFYNPMVKENRFEIDAERLKHWLSVGAQPSDRVGKLMKLANITV